MESMICKETRNPVIKENRPSPKELIAGHLKEALLLQFYYACHVFWALATFNYTFSS